MKPEELGDKKQMRDKLGYGDELLVICSIGGTAAGNDLLDLCGRAYHLAVDKIPNLKMVLVCGPRFDPGSLNMPRGTTIKGYVPNLVEHFAACDLAVVQGGGTTTLELTVLRRPFLYFPLERHCEQQIHVAGRLARHRAGVKMSFKNTTPEILAESIADNIGKEITYDPIPVDGARNAAEKIRRFLV
jgi:UDP-N-acetylglucosamine:LPS N-acetylglucosamine transferase